MPLPAFKKLPRTVIALGVVSFFTDLSSEMIYPLLPLFLNNLLGVGVVALGLIEGLAEATAAILKMVSGVWTDRVEKRKPFVLAGYGIASVARPLIGLAGNWWTVLALRVSDRVGKGIRTSPRDALIGDATPPEIRGAAFGFHRSMDHAGAVAGPLLAAALLSMGGLSLRAVFLLAAIPAAMAMAAIFWGVREETPRGDHPPRGTLLQDWQSLDGNYKNFLIAVGLFALGNSTDAFILLRLSDVGVAPAGVAVLWALHHVVKMVTSYWGGSLSDRVGRKRMVLTGWFLYALIYAGFAAFSSPTASIFIFLAYGAYFGLVEPVEKAWVTDLAPASLRGTALGYYNGTIGLGALPSSLLFGMIWHSFGSPAAFIMGATLALVAAALLVRVQTTAPVE